MDQCADRSRAFHRIRQPDVQRELSRLPHCAAENEQRNKRGTRTEHGKTSLLQTTVPTVVKEKRAAAAVKPEQAKEKSQVADASGNERFFCRRCGAWSPHPKSNEQIGRQSNQLPADEQKKQAVRNNEPEHRNGEERHYERGDLSSDRQYSCAFVPPIRQAQDH